MRHIRTTSDKLFIRKYCFCCHSSSKPSKVVLNFCTNPSLLEAMEEDVEVTETLFQAVDPDFAHKYCTCDHLLCYQFG